MRGSILSLAAAAGRLADDLQLLDAAVQDGQKVLQSLAGVAGQEAGGGESTRSSQLLVQLLPLLLGQQVRFVQHQQNPVWRRGADQRRGSSLFHKDFVLFYISVFKLLPSRAEVSSTVQMEKQSHFQTVERSSTMDPE